MIRGRRTEKEGSRAPSDLEEENILVTYYGSVTRILKWKQFDSGRVMD